jgi:hypothetical protein
MNAPPAVAQGVDVRRVHAENGARQRVHARRREEAVQVDVADRAVRRAGHDVDLAQRPRDDLLTGVEARGDTLDRGAPRALGVVAGTGAVEVVRVVDLAVAVVVDAVVPERRPAAPGDRVELGGR